MIIVSGSLGALVYYVLGGSPALALMAALTSLLVFSWWQFSALQTADRAAIGRQIDGLSTNVAELARALADVSRRAAEVDHRLQAVERHGAAGDGEAGKANTQLSAEFAVLSTLVKDLAETAAAHEQLLAGCERKLATLAFRPAGTPLGAAPAAAAPAVIASTASAAAPGPVPIVRHGALAGLSEADAEAVVRRAVKAGRVEIFLQPIVTFPQRKVRFYEALGRLRADDGTLLEPDSYRDLALSAGLAPEIDLQVLLRAVQVVRRLVTRNREIGVLVDLDTETLADSQAMPRLAEFLDANRALAPAVIFQLGQEQLRGLGPVEIEALAGVVERGFKLAVNRVGSLRFDARDLAARGVKYVKVAAQLVLDRTSEAVSEIHPADLANLFGRHGIELIGEGITSEGQVVDLLDFDLKYGQGDLFAPPKPVRADVLWPRAEREPVAAAPRAEPAARAPTQAAAGSKPAEAKPAEAKAGDAPRRGGLADLAKTTIRRV